MFYVSGHQNPDTDSIVAAIAYARYKGEGMAQAVRLGNISPETDYVLNRFGFKPPPLLPSARTQIYDIDYDHPPKVDLETPLITLWEMMKAQGISSIPVSTKDGSLVGIVSPGDITEYVLKTVKNASDIENLRETLSASPNTLKEVVKISNIMAFHPDDYVDDVRNRMLSTRFRSYPVVDGDNKVLGTISRYHLINYKKKKIILVDHNEKHQSVPGLEQAEIMEIIDHHRLGDVQTGSPVFFRNEPVGSATTIVAGMYHEFGAEPEADLAGLMLAGILSDTVMYKSPTCTDKDKYMASWLSKIANVDDVELGEELFHVFEAELLSYTPKELFFHDFKEYALGGKKIGVGQITVWQSDKIPSAEIQAAMDELRVSERFDMLLFLQTEIKKEGSYILHSEENMNLLYGTFGHDTKEPFFRAGIMSRKKQVVPELTRALT